MKQYKFKFSVIIPIYNVEDYLDETINSVINQSIGFKENIQIILINDGSTDNSEAICLKYSEKYPDNIIYKKQKNSGVSIARNEGIRLAEGKFVTLLDSDDLWDKNAFKEVYKQHKKHLNINIFSCKMVFFEANRGNHPLNYKYKYNKIINILEEYKYPQLSSSSVFIRNEVIKKYTYNKEIKYSEDTKLINEILLEEQKMMLLKKPIYYYRKRNAGNSAIQTTTKDKKWYFDTPDKVYNYLFSLSKKKFGRVIPYIQYTIMYDLQWRLKTKLKQGILTKEETKKYKNQLQQLLKEIDDKIILEQRNLSLIYKIYIMKLKSQKKHAKNMEIFEGELLYKKQCILDLVRKPGLTINVINLTKNKIDIAGTLPIPLWEKEIKIIYYINGKEKEITPISDKKLYSLDDEIINNTSFRLKEKIDIKHRNFIEFKLKYKDQVVCLLPTFTRMGRLSNKNHLHYHKGKWMMYYKKRKIIVEKYSIFKSFIEETKYFLQLVKNMRFKQLLYRYSAKLVSVFYKKKIWLISDRTGVANDNGMHFFKYVVKQQNKNICPYFVLNKASKDYNEMKKYGKVVNYNSFYYKILFLLANKIISSQADNWVISAFGKNEKFYRDMYRFDFVFLQHGITRNNQTAWLNYKNKNIRMLVTASEREYDSFLEENYGYTKNEIKLTGFPRYDHLEDESKKIIALMPTWRQNLAGIVNTVQGTREYNPEFKNSTYYHFMNDIMNHPKLLCEMEKQGYTGIFVIHPSHMKNSVDFKSNKYFKVIDGYADYQKIFKEASLLISDYSSVTFDFAYLKKPIIYIPFDKKTFFENHIYDEGYFLETRDGFGPTATTVKDAVDEIIVYIKKECKMENKYVQRVKNFYKYIDQKNCKRVYAEILKIDKIDVGY